MAEPAFNGAGKAPGMELWRIESLKPVKQPVVNGKFHVGDSYILLVTTKSNSGALTWAIHFWLGAESSQDEQGIAAYKTVELDDSLGGGPVQYREVQGGESQLFLSYFKNSGGIEYLPGGVESGFRKVERDVYETRLLHLKGKRTVRVTPVPVDRASLNKGDVFILDAGLQIYVFNGPTSNSAERAKGVEVAANIKDDERGGRAQIILLSEDPQNEAFWSQLGGYVDPQTLPEGADDSVVDKAASRKLFRISDASGETQFLPVSPARGEHHFEKSQLDGDDVFLLHSVHNKIFLWIGKGATLNEKKQATLQAVQYVRGHGLPDSTPIERVSQGSETAAFKSEFSVWDPPISFRMGARATAASGQDSPIDVAALVARKKTEDTPVDDGSGKLKVWVVKDFKKEEVDAKDYGHFFGGDSYILLYSYTKPGSRSEEHIIYFWLGNDSTADEKGAAALLTVKLDEEMGGRPVQVRVTQGKEPAHFRQLFKGRMIVFRGGNASGFANVSGEGQEQGDVALFHIRGTDALNTVALEVTPSAASLNSEDSFVLVTPSTVFVWQGQGANSDELAVATNTATTLAGSYKGCGGREVVTVREGGEPGQFWEALGGQQEYPARGPGEAAPKDARLFSASNATGTFRVEEIDNFDQSDLNDEDVFLLDTYTQLFVWVGSQSNNEEKEKATAFAQQYVAAADDGRDPDLPIIRVAAGEEPRIFTAHFHGWDADYFSKRSFKDPYQARLESLAASKKAAPSPAASVTLKATPPKPAATAAASSAPAPATEQAPAAAPAASSYGPPVPGAHSYEALKGALPAGVDPASKEEYLDDASFAEVFKMDRATFRAQPKWKRDAAKKNVGLF